MRENLNSLFEQVKASFENKKSENLRIICSVKLQSKQAEALKLSWKQQDVDVAQF
jgi:hypothetical protein